jgi:hypothetical protein
MPELILEPDSTGGESKKNKNKKEKQVLQTLLLSLLFKIS